MLQHQLLQSLDLAGHVLLAHFIQTGALCAFGCKPIRLFSSLFAVDPIDEVLDALVDTARLYPALQVVRNLLGTPALGLTNRAGHRVRNAIGIQDRFAAHIARRAANGLNETALRSQKAFLIGIQNRHQRHLWYVNSFAQQVDSHQYVEGPQTQVSQDLYPLHRVNIAVKVAHLDTVFRQVVGELLGHALGQRGD